MDERAKGTTLVEEVIDVSEAGLHDLARALGTATASQTASLVPFFGPTVRRDERVVEGLGLDLSRALLGGLSYEWRRPFRPGERVHVRVTVDDVFTKGSAQFGVVSAAFTDADGQLVQRQSTTFIERGGS